MDNLKNTFRNCFSIAPKSVFIVLLVLMGMTLSINNAKKTIIISIDGKENKVSTFKGTVNEVLKENNIVLGAKDKATPSKNAKVKKSDRIDIEKAVIVNVAVDGKELKVQTTESTVGKMFEAEGIVIKDTDKVIPSRIIPIENGLNVSVIRVESKVIKESLPVEFTTVVKRNNDALSGTTKVLQDGQAGERVITTELVYEDGKEVSKKVVSDVVAKEPVNKIVSVGTLAVLNLSRGDTGESSINASNIAYKNVIRAQATAYTADFASTGKRPGDRGYGKTATGTTARRNPSGYSSIAVDPKVIPLGTKLYIEGYGYGIAEDTGGAIKGNIIDVFFNSNSECIRWGRRTVNVYILK